MVGPPNWADDSIGVPRQLNVFLSEDGWRRIRKASEATGRSLDDLASAAVEEELLRWEQDQPKQSEGAPLL